MLFNRAQVERYGTDQSIVQRARLHKTASRAAAKATVFLSHSHLDRDLVDAVKNLLASEGVKIYVDWMDEGRCVKTFVEQKVGSASRKIQSEALFFREGMTWPLRASAFCPQILPKRCIFSLKFLA